MNGIGDIGIVVIGRNEGARLRACLDSLLRGGVNGRPDAKIPVVYVDSGSTDGSPVLAAALGAYVVTLTRERPFTAARGRTEGMRWLLAAPAHPAYVQFIDGDCSLAEGWLAVAARWLDEHPRTAVVCGRLRELHPEASLYNYLADLDWDEKPGPVTSSGGFALMRLSALVQVGGWNETLIAGEEPDLCHRLRRAGWLIDRLPDLMGCHDIAMTRFTQWWRRCVRTGYAYGLGLLANGSGSRLGTFRVRKTASILAWGWAFPAALIALAILRLPMLLVIVCGVWAICLIRAVWRERRHRRSLTDALIFSLFCFLAKPGQAWGLLQVMVHRALHTPGSLIEYKVVPAGPGPEGTPK